VKSAFVPACTTPHSLAKKQDVISLSTFFLKKISASAATIANSAKAIPGAKEPVGKKFVELQIDP